MARTNAQKLQAVEKWLGIKTVGVYLGIETVDWSLQQFIPVRDRLKRLGAHYGVIKCGEGGKWYGGDFTDLMHIFTNVGVEFKPYWFCRPEWEQTDIDNCAALANLTGGIILDCEEQFRNQSASLKGIVDGIRAKAPNTCIIVTGYGDPVYAFGWSWDFSSIANADSYQSQWYLGFWSIYHQSGWRAALAWGDDQCAQAFKHFGLGVMYPIQPAINIEGVSQGDLAAIAAFLMNWKASLMVWEYMDLSDTAISLLIQGAIGANVTPVIDPSPTPPPPPVVVPPPVPPSDPMIHIVQPGEYLSEIAANESHRLGYPISWQEIYNLNRGIIGPNPNLIKEGQQLILPHPSHVAPPVPQPAGKREYIVGQHPWDSYGLSTIAQHLGIADWNTGLYLPNKSTIGSNPNLIKIGEVLYY